MKKLALICILFYSHCAYSQSNYDLRGIIRQIYSGDTIKTSFSGDSAKYYTDKGNFSFNKDIWVKGVKLGGGAGVLKDGFLKAQGDTTFVPYASKPTWLGFYTGITDPDGTTRLNLNGKLYSSALYAKTTGNNSIYGSSTTGTVVQAYSSEGGFLFQGDMDGVGSSNNLLQLRRLSTSGNATGDIISITDNPTTVGIKSGKVLSVTIGTTERISLYPRVADGSSAIAHMFDTDNLLSNPGAKLFQVKNYGTEKFYINKDGNAYSNGQLLITSAGLSDYVQKSDSVSLESVAFLHSDTLNVNGSKKLVTRKILSDVIASSVSTGVQSVSDKTANYTVLTGDAGKVITYSHASTTGVFTLPSSPTVGMSITFVKKGAARLTITAPSSTYIASSTVAGSIYDDSTNETYATITLLCIDSTHWVVTSGFGTWTTI